MIVNMDIKEVTERSLRLQVIEEAPSVISEFFFHAKKPKQPFIPEELLSDQEIADIVFDGFESAREVLSSLSMRSTMSLITFELKQNLYFKF